MNVEFRLRRIRVAVPNSNTSYVTRNVNTTWSSVKGPAVKSWRSKTRMNLDASTSFTGSGLNLLSYDECQYKSVQTSSGYHNTISGDLSTSVSYGTFALPTLPSSTSLDTKFLVKASSAVKRFDGSTFVGELASTIRGLKNPLKAIRTLLQEFSRIKRFRDLPKREYARALSGTWLEVQFGLKPLIYDIEDALNGIDALGKKIYTERVTATLDEAPTVPTVNVYDNVSGEAFITQRQISSVLTRRHTKIYGVVKIKPGSAASSRFGFTPECLVPAIWECIPWSFLIDYLIPVGDWIEAVSFRKSSLAWCCRTRVSTSTQTVTTAAYARPGCTITIAKHGKVVFEKRNIERVPYMPNPLLPGVAVKASVGALLNSLALLFSIHRRK